MKNEISKVIGGRIREKRLEAKLTQEKLAEKIDIGAKYLSDIETGRSNISIKKLFKIAEALNENPEYFISGRNIENKELESLFSRLSSKNQKNIIEIMRILIKND